MGDPQPLRADAARNRERILDSACAAFAKRGLEVPLEEIAVDAGVGIATLYRRFPTRDDLLAAAAERLYGEYQEALDEGLADPDPWQGFSGFVRRVCAIQAGDPGMAELFTLPFPAAEGFEARRVELYQGFLTLSDRAKEAGVLRPDFAPEDLPMLLMANAGVLRSIGGAAPSLWRRLVEYLLQAFRATGDELPPAPSPAKMRRALSGGLSNCRRSAD